MFNLPLIFKLVSGMYPHCHYIIGWDRKNAMLCTFLGNKKTQVVIFGFYVKNFENSSNMIKKNCKKNKKIIVQLAHFSTNSKYPKIRSRVAILPYELKTQSEYSTMNIQYYDRLSFMHRHFISQWRGFYMIWQFRQSFFFLPSFF